MKKFILSFALILSFTTFAQQYQTAIGFKGGYPGFGALSIKHFFGSSTALEGNIGGGKNHLWVQGILAKNNPLYEKSEWYWGVGADFLSYNNGHHKYYKNQYYGYNFGIMGLLGVEYTFEELPINVALDCGPRLNVSPYFWFGFGGSVAIRFAIK
jgi:hypothetical protein